MVRFCTAMTAEPVDDPSEPDLFDDESLIREITALYDADPTAQPRGRRKATKQISMFVPVADWCLLRDEALRRGKSMSALCRDWIKPQLKRLRTKAERKK